MTLFSLWRKVWIQCATQATVKHVKGSSALTTKYSVRFAAMLAANHAPKSQGLTLSQVTLECQL
jgi:hypothetical protein